MKNMVNKMKRKDGGAVDYCALFLYEYGGKKG